MESEEARFMMPIGEINFVISLLARQPMGAWLIRGDIQRTTKLFIAVPVASQMADDIDFIQHL